MIFRKQLKNPQTVMRIGMTCLLVFLVWPRFLHLGTSIGEDWIDGVRGFFFGLGVGFNLLALRLRCRQRRDDGGTC